MTGQRAAVGASSRASAAAVSLLDEHDALLLDLDGTLFRGRQAVPGAPEAVAQAAGRGVGLAFITNNASRTPDEVAAHLRELGFAAAPEQVVTSAQAAATLLAQRLRAGAPVVVLGSAGLAHEVRAVGLTATDRADGAVGVVQGYSPDLGWRQLAEGCLAIQAGALWVATNLDPTLPTERGLLPGNGSMVAALRTATGAEPVLAGKPEPALLDAAVERLGAARPLMVGDRLDSDIEGARAARVPSLLVLTGVSDPSAVLAAPAGQRPDYIAADLGGLQASADALRSGQQPGWKVARDGGVLVLHATGDPADRADPLAALRALCAEHWTGAGGPVALRAADAHAAAALQALGLDGQLPGPDGR